MLAYLLSAALVVYGLVVAARYQEKVAQNLLIDSAYICFLGGLTERERNHQPVDAIAPSPRLSVD